MIRKFMSIVFVLLIMVSVITGCSSSSNDENNTSAVPADSKTLKSEVPFDKDVAAGSVQPKSDVNSSESKSNDSNGNTADAANTGNANALTASDSSTQALNNAILSQRKIIRNANVSIEVDDFEKAYGRIKTIISAFGFVQESSIKRDKIYVDDKEKLITKGTIIVRVDKDRFESVLGDIKGLGTLIDENIKSDDVTDKFFDTESRLRLLRYEESRLEEYLKKITDPDTIFKTESRLTDIRHEIESLTGTLKKWTDLVELSTITIDMSEKMPASKIEKEKTYWEKLASGFTTSFKGIVKFCSELLLLLVQILPVLLVFGIIIFAAVLFYRKVIRNKNKSLKDKKDNDDKDYDMNA